MSGLLLRLLGWSCCGEFTPWETKSAQFSRPPADMEEKVTAGMVDRIEFTQTWQERRCRRCGKVQQRRLEY